MDVLSVDVFSVSAFVFIMEEVEDVIIEWVVYLYDQKTIVQMHLPR